MGLKKKVDEFLEFKEGFVDKLNVVFGAWGLWVYDHPWTTIFGSLVLSLLPIIGFLPGVATWVDGADNLYSLPVSKARNDGIIHDTIFSDAISRASFMVITSDPPGKNILTWDRLNTIKQVDEIAQGYRVDQLTGKLIGLPVTELYYPEWFGQHPGIAPDKTFLTYRDICAPDPVAGCRVQSVFEMGVFDTQKMLPTGSPPELWVFDGMVFSANRKGFSPDFILGSYTKQPCTRDIPTTLIAQIFTPDRYQNSSKTGFSTANIECILEAKAVNFVYELWDKPEFQAREMAWEYNFYEIMKGNKHYNGLMVGANAFRSRDDELSKSTTESDDVIFVVYTFILLVSYTAAVNFNCNQYRNKALSSLSGSLACILGLYAGLGIPSMWGTEFVPTSLVCPFIVMGVGADDIFVLISSYALAYGEESPRQRCAVSLRGCGVSVVMTTITNVIAFAIGVQSPYLSIKNFCIFTLFGLAFSLVYELTLFYAVLCLEARKEDAQMACLCGIPKLNTADKKPFDIYTTVSTFQVVSVLCHQQIKSIPTFHPLPHRPIPDNLWFWKRWWIWFSNAGVLWYEPEELTLDKGEKEEQKNLLNDTQSSSSRDSYMSASDGMQLLKEPTYVQYLPVNPPINRYDLHPKLRHPYYQSEPSGTVGMMWRRFFGKHFTAFILHPKVKLAIILLFMTNLIIAICGITRLQQGLEMVDLSPDDSYLRTYDTLNLEYMNKVDLPVEVFYPSSTPWHDPAAIAALRLFVDRVNARPENNVIADPLTRMASDPTLAPSLLSGNRSEFNRALKQAITDPNSAYKQFEYDFVWEGVELISFRQQLLPSGTKSSQERAHWMITMREDCDWLAQLDEPGTIPIDAKFYNYMLVFFESDILIRESVISSLTTASMALLVVTLLLIPDLGSGLLVMLIMFLIDITVIGYMAWWNVNLNMISMVILVISIGFAVDYSAHICYAFVNGIGPTRNIRVCEAMVLVGTPLFHGATSNFLGIALLGASSSYIFRVFFKMMTLVVVIGISHGLILLPVILSLIGKVACAIPVAIEDDEESFYPKLSEDKMKRLKTRDLRAAPTAAEYEVIAMSVFPTTTVKKDCAADNPDTIWYADARTRKVDFDLPRLSTTYVNRANNVEDDDDDEEERVPAHLDYPHDDYPRDDFESVAGTPLPKRP